MVWHVPYAGDYNIVMSHISHIREKIEDDPGHPMYIQTVWGVGYKFNEKQAASELAAYFSLNFICRKFVYGW